MADIVATNIEFSRFKRYTKLENDHVERLKKIMHNTKCNPANCLHVLYSLSV